MNGFDLLVTVGPASEDRIGALVDAGATGLRLNASHIDPGGLEAVLARVRDAAPDVPVVVDLQGAKMRLGRFGARALEVGGPVILELSTPGDEADAGAEGGEDGRAEDGAIPVPHTELFTEVGAGDVLSCDDGRLRLQVERAEPRRLVTRALGGGLLRPRKGINRMDHPVRLGGLTPTDAAFVDAAARFPDVSFAFSFMTDGREAEWVRERAPGRAVAGKVERGEAVEELAELAVRVDSVWICRGDLGAQLGPGALARFVAGLEPRRLPAPVVMAGQVLQHLTDHPEPTRSEVCHLFDLLARGYAGIVLSDETAVGRDPVGATAEAARLLRVLG